jgi:hypothetical protein
MGIYFGEFMLREICLPGPAKSASFLNSYNLLEMKFAMEELKES